MNKVELHKKTYGWVVMHCLCRVSELRVSGQS